MIERERRFLVAVEPDPLPAPTRIVQGYLVTSPIAVRVRLIDGRQILSIKAGSGLRRTEIERDLTVDEFDALWAEATDLRIDKRRHRLALPGGLTAELDLFDGDLTGHSIVEVEFDSDAAAEAFVPPPWFGREITDDGRYTNASLSRHGWPADG